MKCTRIISRSVLSAALLSVSGVFLVSDVAAQLEDSVSVYSQSVGSYPQVVANNGRDTVLKLRATDGVHLARTAVAAQPLGLAYDGSKIWVTNSVSDTVTTLRARDGQMLGSFGAGSLPNSVAFGGTNVWVTDQSSNTVTGLRARNGKYVAAVTVGNFPIGIIFDGNSLWTADSGSNTVSKIGFGQ